MSGLQAMQVATTSPGLRTKVGKFFTRNKSDKLDQHKGSLTTRTFRKTETSCSTVSHLARDGYGDGDGGDYVSRPLAMERRPSSSHEEAPSYEKRDGYKSQFQDPQGSEIQRSHAVDAVELPTSHSQDELEGPVWEGDQMHFRGRKGPESQRQDQDSAMSRLSFDLTASPSSQERHLDLAGQSYDGQNSQSIGQYREQQAVSEAADLDKALIAHRSQVEGLQRRHQEELRKQREDLDFQIAAVGEKLQKQKGYVSTISTEKRNLEISLHFAQLKVEAAEGREREAVSWHHKARNDHRAALAKVEQTYDNIVVQKQQEWQQEARQSIEKARQEGKSAIDTISNEHKKKMFDLNQKLQFANGQAVLDRQGLESTHQAHLRTLKGEHADQITGKERIYNTKLTALNHELEKKNIDAATEKQDLLNTHEGVIQSLQQKHEDNVTEQRRLYKEARETLQSELDTLRTHVQEIEDEAEKEANELKEQIRQLVEEHSSKMEQLNAEHQKEKNSQASTHKSEVKRLKAEHEAQFEQYTLTQQKHLQAQVQELNDALSSRDDKYHDRYHGTIFKTADLPSKTDNQLRDQFLALRLMVEDIGRLASTAWRQDQHKLSPQVLQKISKQNQRVARKAVIQHMVWTQLFEFVFGSPFRILGEEGKVLEKEWLEQGHPGATVSTAASYVWPIPGIQTERWRYLTVKECHEVLTKGKPSTRDKRSRLRFEFTSCSKALMQKLEATIGQLVDLSTQNLEQLKKLSSRAATIWLDFTMHRCRIVVRLTGDPAESLDEIVSMIQKGSSALTVLPEVGRYGNVKGEELDSFTIISGCAGETLPIA